MPPTFLTIDQVIRIHRSMIETYGGSMGILDQAMLKSAVAMPQATFGGQFLHGDLYAMAAAYLYHLVQNHSFQDGNKRVGAAAAVVFLAVNDITIQADQDGLAELTLRVATGQADKEAIAEFFRERSE
ncbi:MAG: type II toxin-antitoxin system death-on-curing family toxin [Rhodanobacteraceae bacterium]